MSPGPFVFLPHMLEFSAYPNMTAIQDAVSHFDLALKYASETSDSTKAPGGKLTSLSYLQISWENEQISLPPWVDFLVGDTRGDTILYIEFQKVPSDSTDENNMFGQHLSSSLF